MNPSSQVLAGGGNSGPSHPSRLSRGKALYTPAVVRLIEETDYFEIVNADAFPQASLERFRKLMNDLVTTPPPPTEQIAWKHIVELYGVFHEFTLNDGDYLAGRLLEEHWICCERASDVTIWIKGGLPAGSFAFIIPRSPWTLFVKDGTSGAGNKKRGYLQSIQEV